MNEESKPFVHHWILYECPADFEQIYLVNNSVPDPKKCTDNSLPWRTVEGLCNKISLAWAVGGDLQTDFPAKLGYPVGGSSQEFKYFFLQMHYENPEFKRDVRIYSGIKLYGTTNYREIEFGVFTAGTAADVTGIIIPPVTNALSIEYMCRENFFRNIFGPTGEITIFAHAPHTHLAGTQVFSKVVRNGREVEFIANNKYYDFNYQYINFLQKPVIMRRVTLLINILFKR